MVYITNFFNFIKGIKPTLNNALKRFYKKQGIKKERQKYFNYALTLCAFLLIAVLAELFIFNFRHWGSVFNKPYRAEYTVGSGLYDNGDGTYTVIGDDRSIEFSNLSGRLKTAYVNIQYVDGTDEAINTDFNARDISHYSYYYLNSRQLYPAEERSFYVTFHLYGDVRALKLTPFAGGDKRISVDIIFNPIIPIFIRWERILLLFLTLTFIYFFRPASELHNIKYLKLDKTTRALMLALFFVTNALILLWVNKLNPFYQGEYGINTRQYQNLAEAFKEGQVSLLYEPSEKLIALENPYDMSLRAANMEFEEYAFDHAYFEGKYYVYFGVVPVALVYFPYYLITGKHIHNHTVCYIGILLILLGMLLLVDRLIRRYYKKCSVAVWFLGTWLLLLGSYVVYVTKRPDLYSVPIIYGVAFSLLGMWAYLSAIKEKQSDGLKIRYMILGSILTALVAGCRPQMFLVVILDVIILRKYVFSLEYIKSDNGAKAVASVCAPMAVIGGLLMAYNAVRFGSPFDFGAFYNLTFNDMRNRGWVWGRVPLGAVTYLLKPVELKPEYPYFGNVWMSETYMGETIQETTYGGVFMTSPFALMTFAALFYKRKLNRRSTLYIMSIASFIISLVIMVFDTINSGILARYFFDFSFLMMLSALCAIFSLLKIKGIRKSGAYNTVIWLLIFFVLFEVLYQMMVFMLDSGDYLRGNRRDLFRHYYYLFGFGM